MSVPDSQPKIMIFIPTYRCASELSRVFDKLAEIDPALIRLIAVIDNQSPDNTRETAIECATKLDIPVVVMRNDDNYDLGGSHKHAFSLGKQYGMDYLVVLHGDDQADIRDLVPHMVSGAAFKHDCYLGSRFAKGSTRLGYSALRTFGNRVYNLIFSIVNDFWITDLGSGLNMYRLSAIDIDDIKTFPDNLTFNYVMLMYSIWKKHDIKFFPISWREEDQQSNVRLFRQASRVLYIVGLRLFSTGKTYFSKEFRETPHEVYAGEAVFEQERRA